LIRLRVEVPGRRPTWAQIRRFCERQGFRAAATDHNFYDKVLPDGSTAGTKISFGLADTETVPAALWSRIWKRQLRLRSEGQFWQGLDGGPVEYDVPVRPAEAERLPDFLARHLRHDRHLTEEAISATTREEAQRLLNEWYSRDQDG
jgi:hypothetical protein